LVALARKVEALGYAVILVPDHIDANILSPFLALVTIAEVTERLRVSTYVIDNDFRHPALLAKEAATCDLLTSGRLELALGAGWNIEDYTTTGIPFDAPAVRVARLEEAVQIVKHFFTQDTVSFVGEHYTLTDLVPGPKPAQRPHPPIFIGGAGKRLLSLAGREADIVGLVPRARGGTLDFADVSHASTAQKIAWVRDAAGERFAQLELNTLVFDCVFTDQREQGADALAEKWGLPREHILNSVHFLVGTTQQMADDIQQWREQFGISYIAVFPEHMEAFAPIVAQLSGR
jgi:probable F420-dependent oxidoreductase